MKIRTKAALGAAALAVAGALAAAPLLAQGAGPDGPDGPLVRVHSRGGDGHEGGGWQGGWHGRRHDGFGQARLIEQFDTDKDGKITQAEIDTARTTRLKSFDGDADGSLTLQEYQALWLDAMRERMVDAFQEQDNDGDGKVTQAEFNARFERLVERLDRNDDGVLDEADRRGRDGGPGHGRGEPDERPAPPPGGDADPT